MDIRKLTRRPGLVLSLVLLAACTSVDGPSEPPFGPDAQVYRIIPHLIRYDFVDTSASSDLHLIWIDSTFFGINCIGFTPRSPVDTIGTFQFYSQGINQGYLQQRNGVITDTVQGVFLSGAEGTRGNYAINSAGRISLFWTDGGTQTRYFDPLADIRFIGDTLRSIADLRFNGDSVRAQWNVSWINTPVCSF